MLLGAKLEADHLPYPNSTANSVVFLILSSTNEGFVHAFEAATKIPLLADSQVYRVVIRPLFFAGQGLRKLIIIRIADVLYENVPLPTLLWLNVSELGIQPSCLVALVAPPSTFLRH